MSLLVQNHVDAQLMLGSIAYEEHVAFVASGAVEPATPDVASLGSKDENKKLQTAKHYFGKVLENANKNVSRSPRTHGRSKFVCRI
jgi:hypothetical protein